jgi:hypothetical protein
MKTLPCLLAALALVAIAGCASTPTSRIADHKAAYNQWPPDVQAAVAAGKIAVGFTPEQVRIALGEPSRKFSRTTADGTAETWAYADNPPRFSFGLGLASWGRGSSVGGGVGVSTGGYRDGERMHVIFDGGHVSAIETAKRGDG